jgi:flagellar protein FlbD
MIKVKKIDGSVLWINPHQIESMECVPDLTVTMLSGRKIMLGNNPQEVIDQIIEYRKKIAVDKQEI